MKAIVVAMDRNRAIGAKNDLPWQRDLPADLRHFKERTTGTSLIMGRKTFESIVRPLPNRQNIVVTHGDIAMPGVDVAHSLEDAYRMAVYDDISVIGGGEIYAQTIDDMDTLYVTHVDAEFSDATVFFPEIDAEHWRLVSEERHDSDEHNKYSFSWLTYVKV